MRKLKLDMLGKCSNEAAQLVDMGVRMEIQKTPAFPSASILLRGTSLEPQLEKEGVTGPLISSLSL